MYGRVWGSHSCPPMILPSSRGTAASHAQKEVTVTKNVFNNNKYSCVRVSVYWSLCMCLCLYQQLQPSAAEPAVSWCLVNNQRTPGHTPAHIYMLPAPLCSAHSPPPLVPLSVDPICVLTHCSYLLVPSVNPNLLSYQAPVFMFAHALLPHRGTPPVVMSSVHLINTFEPRSPHI